MKKKTLIRRDNGLIIALDRKYHQNTSPRVWLNNPSGIWLGQGGMRWPVYKPSGYDVVKHTPKYAQTKSR